MGRIVLQKQEQPQEQSQELPTVDEVLEEIRENLDEFTNLVRERVAEMGGGGGRKALNGIFTDTLEDGRENR